MTKMFIDKIQEIEKKEDNTPAPGDNHNHTIWNHASHSKRDKSGPIYTMSSKTPHFHQQLDKRALDPGPGEYGSRTVHSFNRNARYWKPIRAESENRGSNSARR